MLKNISFLLILVFAGVVLSGCSQSDDMILRELPMDNLTQDDMDHQVNEKYVIDVNIDESLWKTKEAEFFTVTFPQEWYWMESDSLQTGYHSQVITNNLNFDINKNAEISIFSGVGSGSPITLLNDTEILMTYRVTPTKNAGTPQDSLDAIFQLAKKNNSSVQCEVLADQEIPYKAYCLALYEDSQMQKSYYIINENNSLTFTIRMTQENKLDEDVISKIVNSIILK